MNLIATKRTDGKTVNDYESEESLSNVVPSVLSYQGNQDVVGI